jgi:hypothetical protein
MKLTAGNSTFAIGGVSCSADSLVLKIPPIANLQIVKKIVLKINKPRLSNFKRGFL